MESYRYLLDVALILPSMRVLGLLIRRIEMPQVVGALVAGLLLGPTYLNTAQESGFLDYIAETGVIVLMFSAGLETDTSELKKGGRNNFVIAVIGVLVPLIAGYVLASLLSTESIAFLQSIFIDVILTTISVSVSVETLKEMGKLSTPSGNTILGTALIDDILEIIALTIITGMADISVQLIEVMSKVIALFMLAVIVGVFTRKDIEKLLDCYRKIHCRFSILSFAFCLLFAHAAEVLFGVTDVTGILITGLTIGDTGRYNYVQTRIETLSYLLISPTFFANIGSKIVSPETSISITIFSVLLLVLAILTRIAGYGPGAKLCRYENIQSLRVDIGMVSRGEVTLTIASKGMKVGLMNEAFLGSIIIMVILTTVITPVLSKIVFKDHENDPDVYASLELIKDCEKVEQNEKLTQKVLEQS